MPNVTTDEPRSAFAPLRQKSSESGPDMPRIAFTRSLERLIDCPPREAAGATVREILETVFRESPRLRGYLLDDRGALRQHVVVFVSGEEVRDRAGLSDPVSSTAEIFVMQALSGG
jgi:molybdopterin synthase sulfur carrier subunit